VKCNIASQEFGQAKDFRIGNKIFTTDEYNLLIEESKTEITWSTSAREPALKSCKFHFGAQACAFHFGTAEGN
jgi:hypothetical protein